MLRCPHCDKFLSVVKATIHQGDTVDYSLYCMPNSWREYSGWAISDIEICDPDYLDELLAQTTPKITGTMREAISFFVNKRGSPLEPPQ